MNYSINWPVKRKLIKKIDKLATKEEFKQEVAKLATKEELKEEVARLVTKEEFRREIEKLATKESLEIVATEVLKLSGTLNNLEMDMSQVKLRLDKIETKLDDKFGLLITKLVGIARDLKEIRIEKNFLLSTH